MEKVIIEKDSLRKCIILEKDGEFVFRSGPGEFHEEVRDYFRAEEPELKEWRVRGGGRVHWSDLLGRIIKRVKTCNPGRYLHILCHCMNFHTVLSCSD